jgi:hypothetical protein
MMKYARVAATLGSGFAGRTPNPPIVAADAPAAVAARAAAVTAAASQASRGGPPLRIAYGPLTSEKVQVEV